MKQKDEWKNLHDLCKDIPKLETDKEGRLRGGFAALELSGPDTHSGSDTTCKNGCDTECYSGCNSDCFAVCDTDCKKESKKSDCNEAVSGIPYNFSLVF